MAVNNIVTAANLAPTFEIGTRTPNLITIRTDDVGVTQDAAGVISSPPGVLTYDATTSMLEYDNGQGGTQTIDLSALTTDIMVDGGSFDAASSVLTLTDNSGTTPDVTIDLSSLLGVSTDANNALSNGADGKPFLAVTDLIKVSTDADNLITSGADGGAFLDCAAVETCTDTCTDVFGNDLFNAFTV